MKLNHIGTHIPVYYSSVVVCYPSVTRLWSSVTHLYLSVLVGSLDCHSGVVSDRFIITPPARRAWRSFKFAPFLVFFSMSKVEPSLMGDTAGFPLLFSALLHII